MRTLIFLLLYIGVCGLTTTASAQTLFTYDSLQRGMDQLRKSTIEQIVITGDRSPEGDQKILDTLRMFLADRVYNSNRRKSWHNFQRTVKHITIRHANWRSLPLELGEFSELFELTFVNCPYLHLQAINDQLRQLDPESRLYKKCHREIISLTFSETSLDSLVAFQLDKELLGDLRELRFIRVKKMNDHCENLLNQLKNAYPQLGWLTLAACDLDDQLNLDTLRSFEHLQMVSLTHNFLTKAPLVHKNLSSLDLSYNLIRDFRPRDAENQLKFLYLDCNLFQYPGLYAIIGDTVYEHLDVLTYECNNVLPKNLQILANAFDRDKVANFLSYTPRYANDFNPAPPDCRACQTYRDEFVAQLLTSIQFMTADNTPCRLDFDPQRQRIVWTCFGNGPGVLPTSVSTYACQNIAECKRISGTTATDPWIWEVVFLVESCDGVSSKPDYLVARLQGGDGTVTVIEVEANR